MRNAERGERQIDRRIVQAEAKRTLAICYCLRRATGMGKDRGAQAERQRRGAVQRQRVSDGSGTVAAGISSPSSRLEAI